MSRHHVVRLVPPVVALILFVGLPGRVAAQVAQKGADVPSRNRETRVQHDSLAVHFLRFPKAKPAAGQRVIGAVPSSAKFGGRREPVASLAPAATPLPTKKAAAKR